MKLLSLILKPQLLLLHLSQFSAENVKLNTPVNAICACVGETLNYTCTIAVDPGSPTGSTVWSGSALMCAGNEISLIHDRFDNGIPASGGCNGGDIVARSVGVEGMNYTSELDVLVRDELNGRVINCSWDSRPGPSLTITVASACGDIRPIVNLIVSPGQLTFSWSRLHSECSTVKYRIMSDCGNCSGAIIDETSATCSELQLSETETNCTFSIQGMTRGFTGTQSNPITVTLKVPGAPQVDITPVYYSEQDLIKLIVEIRPMPDFSIYKRQISGAIESYTIHYSPSVNLTIPAKTDCRDSIRFCEYTFDVPGSECPSLSDGSIMVSISAANRLGPGRQGSEPVSIGCINRFVTVTTSNSTLTCEFLNNQSSIKRTCSVEYRVCGQEEVFTSEGNSTLDVPDRVILQLSLLNGSDCYSYNVTASDGVSTVIVVGMTGSKSDEGDSSKVIIAVVVVLVLLFLASFMVAIALLIWCWYRKKQKIQRKFAVPLDLKPGNHTESDGSTRNTEDCEDHEEDNLQSGFDDDCGKHLSFSDIDMSNIAMKVED